MGQISCVKRYHFANPVTNTSNTLSFHRKIIEKFNDIEQYSFYTECNCKKEVKSNPSCKKVCVPEECISKIAYVFVSISKFTDYVYNSSKPYS